ncbi:Site-specific DNA recombinase [Mesobacillus persicus]|uniref:Site-specific DNA recombinase n=1 Tax=Mesobacillus persicus TaxID=930146 RepID=A0A1H8J6N3_9BACI|nr:recombinase family protein [Mesobacillus persicus]SEN76329.1 Site-specific DNA recombinase [Mesobacillus persicus]
MKKTVIYIRQSLDQDKQKNSLEMQQITCLEFAHRNGWLIHEIFNEGMCSARLNKIEDRREISRLLDEAKKGLIARVLVFKRDRIARNTGQYIEALKTFQAAGVELYFTADNEPPVFNGPVGEFVEALLGGIAEQEGENIVNRLINARRTKILQGKWGGGSPPLGYSSKNGDLSFDESSIKVREIFENFIRFGKGDIDADYLDKTLKDTVGKSVTKLRKIISNPIYKGTLIQRLDGKTIPFPGVLEDLRIVTDDEWYLANDMLNNMFGEETLNPDNNDEHENSEERYTPLLMNKIHCGSCSVTLTITKKKYKCKQCSIHVDMEHLDEKVIQAVLEIFMTRLANDWPKLHEIVKRRYLAPVEKKQKELAKAIKDNEEQIKMNYQMYLKEGSKDDILEKSVTRYKYISKEQEQLSSMHFSLNQFLSNFKPQYEYHSGYFRWLKSLKEKDLKGELKEESLKKEALQLPHLTHIIRLIDKVIVSKDKTTIKLFIPPEVTLREKREPKKRTRTNK